MIARVADSAVQAVLDLKDVLLRPRRGFHNILEVERIWPSLALLFLYAAASGLREDKGFVLCFALPRFELLSFSLTFPILVLTVVFTNLVALAFGGGWQIRRLISVWGYIMFPATLAGFLNLIWLPSLPLWFSTTVIISLAGICALFWPFMLCSHAAQSVYGFSRRRADLLSIFFLLFWLVILPLAYFASYYIIT